MVDDTCKVLLVDVRRVFHPGRTAGGRRVNSSVWNWVCWLLLLAGIAVYAVFATRRYLAYLSTSLPEEVRDDLADRLLTALRDNCGGPDRSITLASTFWPSTELSFAEVLRLLEYLRRRGWLNVLNNNYVRDAIFLFTLPKSVALTPDSYERWTPRAPEEPKSITFNGPTHLGDGHLVNNGAITYEWTVIERDVSKLALSLHRESMRQAGELAQQLEEAAEMLSMAVDARNLDDPWVKRTVRWVADLANNTAAGVISGGLIAAATALLGKL